MNALIQLVRQHPYTAGWTAAAICNVMVLRMPPPDASSGKFYKWAFGVLHTFSGALPRIASNFLPPNSFLYKLIAGGNGGTNGAPNGAPPVTH